MKLLGLPWETDLRKTDSKKKKIKIRLTAMLKREMFVSIVLWICIQQMFTYLKSTIGRLEKGMKYVPSQQ